MYGNGLANTFANVEVSRPTTILRQHQDKTRFLSVTRKTKIMYKDTDYDVLERNVKYIPWKKRKRNGTPGIRHFWFVL